MNQDLLSHVSLNLATRASQLTGITARRAIIFQPRSQPFAFLMGVGHAVTTNLYWDTL